MDFSAVGKKIRELRRNIGLSQEELSEGICTQAQISKIEKGDVYPYASTLYLISQKLGVDVNHFFDIGMTPRLDYVQEVKRQLILSRRTLDYKEMKQIVDTEIHNPLFSQNKKNMQLLLWHKGIYQYELDKDLDTALETLWSSIQLTHISNKYWSEREIEIMLTMGVIHFEEDQLEEALQVYKNIKQYISTIPYLNDYTIKSRLYYNLARTLTRLEEHEESIKYCRSGIDWCIEKDNLYVLGELHYQMGYNYELLDDINTGLQYMKKALIVFELQQDEKYSKYIKEKIVQLEKK
ncbi:helix-turn-helix domain-containing protein [Rossellomorea aquimaris]|uniref:Helix-turn-helix transcriptional regulator n=1 Tax=Rossellomorea aquimaris TaxID=189382 RepID=A0A5D4TUM3_9BACI|nr:helix-turn-helix domain-containing protein [Rossellomorea aquimaris]TYS78531.1 helix-turn-helix transcriptional regulator [Rossellomorea aquimaris]